MKEDKALEQAIKNWVNQEEEIPESVKQKTIVAYEEIRAMSREKNRKSKYKKQRRWTVAAVGLLLVGVISIQPPVLAGIKKVLFGGYYTGVQSAIDKGYLQEIKGVVSESNGIQLEIIGGLIDPTIIHLRLKVSAEDPKQLKGFKYNSQHKVPFVDQFTLIDDQGRVIQQVNEEGSYTIPVKGEDGKEIWLLSSTTEEVDLSRRDEGEVYIDMIWNSSEGNYKGIKGVTLQSQKLGSLKGDWELEVDFGEEVAADEGSGYEVIKGDERLQIVEARLYRTGLKLEFITTLAIDESIISNTKVVTQTGAVYTSDRAGWMEQTEQGEKVILTFGILEEELGEQFAIKVEGFEGLEVQLEKTSK